ncbi:MAG: nucleotidyltransferase domain-containing protein [Candidatus Methanomethylicia archaeon]|nr:nucleotidyltransferase domain-containing protein [Candidatus Methanomethylicia archaeon]
MFKTYPYKPFTIDQAYVSLNLDERLVRVILSELCKLGWILRLEKGIYIAFSPYSIILRDNLWEDKLRQKEYLPLILMVIGKIFEKYGGRLVSIVIFGSIARGEAKPNSDLDILIIVEKLPEKYSERINQVIEILEDVREVKLWLWKRKKIFCNVEFLMLTPDEASIVQPVYLDMLDNSILVYDRNYFFRQILEKFSKKLRALGAEKIVLPDGRWFWKLKSQVSWGEVITL